ncbi:MAG: rhomboid family intramembrane serine protease [Haloarculaceae archaeon]
MHAGPAQVAQLSSPLPVWPALVAAAVLFSVGIALTLARPRGAWARRLRKRLLLGVPWGTLLTIAGVVAFYLFVQGAWEHPNDPLVIPFRSWSYLYPVGVLTAAFAHASRSHIVGNVIGTLAFAPIAEYAWSHFPTERGSQSFGGRRTNPFLRVFAVPLAAIGVGLLTSLFALGPVIGFSGVVFAFAGFALVFAPLAVVVSLVGAQIISLLYSAVTSPVTVAGTSPQVVTPWFANIAIQGHYIGLLFGVVVGGWLAARRDYRPSPGRVWLAVVALAVSESLWALYWYAGAERYVLFRAAGAVAVFLLAALIAAALTASWRPLISRIDLRRRETAVGLLLALTVALSVVAIPVNLVAVDAKPLPEGVSVGGYDVTYAENVPDQYVSAVNVSLFGQTTQLNTSGVIVVSEDRNIFQTVVSKTALAYRGSASVVVGGLGWRQRVAVNRTGWSAVGNDTAYKVYLRPAGGDRRLVFQSDAVRSRPRIAGRRVVIAPTAEAFELLVQRGNQSIASHRIPTVGHNVTAGGLTFNRTRGDLYAEANGTRVQIASRAG